MGIEELCKKLDYLSEEERAQVREAYRMAEEAHKGQTRKSGEPYIFHPLAVAGILADLQMDVSTIVAALLHDVVEDTEISLKQIEERFGPDVSHLVDGVTKLGRLKYKTKEEQQAENHRKMFIAMAKDIRVILIKLADRLHNMRTLKYLSEEKQREIANETLEIFAPLAHRLGISTIKWELEDISLRYLNPQQYYRIVNLMQKKRSEREQYIEEVIRTLREKLAEMMIEADISGRPKHIYSIYRKMVQQKKQFNEIYDLLAVRVIVNSIRDCYAVLGIIHTLWKPMPGRFKDYIAMPKPNMYQSLHTTVVGPKGEPLEVQIRTWEMHRTAEYGVAAHWAYKEGKAVTDDEASRNLSWFREILEWQQDYRDAKEFMESLKTELFSDVVFVFTPKGDVVELPSGSVPLDFAYRIHTEVGNRCIGAKVNGKIVPLDHRLKTGDIVEILTSKHSYGPSRDWLKIAQSSHARSKIRQWFKKEKREENIAKGQEELERELKKQGFAPAEWMTNEKLEAVAKAYNLGSREDLLAALGYGGISLNQVMGKLTEKARKDQRDDLNLSAVKQHSPSESKPTHGVRVKGVDNLLVRFSRCCTPVPGDEIVGFVTKGRGVSIHRNDCPNIQQLKKEQDRIIEVEWEGVDDSSSYPVDIEITGYDRKGFLNEVLQTVSEAKTNISAISGRSDKNKVTTILMTINIHNLDHLHKVVDKVKSIKDIYSVRRITQ
ncbi:MAG: (p)ppGpp synthetase [Bacillus thermozeamaize]|uniref:GTP pyrophosphokinase n=1 Tax=Bacillus thermozeamaize TaxID=230954 RepID=A0A1Y3PM15_9BACI|nr:MAG: (p)ppGpp synthetase [Bacillus thermozeamaize]